MISILKFTVKVTYVVDVKTVEIVDQRLEGCVILSKILALEYEIYVKSWQNLKVETTEFSKQSKSALKLNPKA